MNRTTDYLGLLALSAALLAPATAVAQAPALLPVQGVLTDENGIRITTAVNVTFSLYDVATGGTAFHTESLAVTPDNGLFTVYLGTNTALELSNFSMSEIYLGMEIESDGEMTPRFRLGTAPYAAFAQACGDAATLEGSAAAAFAPAAHTHDWTEVQNRPAGLDDGDDVLAQATVEGYAQAVCYDTAAELSAAVPNWDQDASNDLTTATTFAGDVTGTSGAMQIAANAVTATEIANNAVRTAEIADNAVTSAKIAANTINAGDIATNGVGSAEIANNAVTSAKIATSAVTMAEANLPIGTVNAFRSTGLIPGVNYLFGNAVSLTPTANGTCLVVVSGAVQGVDAGDVGTMRVNAAFRIGAAGAPSRQGYVSSGITSPTPTTATGSNTAVINVTAGNAYYFGCALDISPGFTNDGLYCSASWICT